MYVLPLKFALCYKEGQIFSLCVFHNEFIIEQNMFIFDGIRNRIIYTLSFSLKHLFKKRTLNKELNIIV